MKQYTREEISNEVVGIMNKLFEIPTDEITSESKLMDDLDLDSIDAVEMIVQLQKMTGKRIQPEQFQSVRTVNDVVDVLEKLLNENNQKN